MLLVRKGNPKHVRDWDDLVRPGISVVTPNPKTSGGARWNYLAAWGYAKRKWGSDDKAQDFVAKLYKNVPVLDSGARGATTTFVQRGIGDVLIAWENEALLATEKLGKDQFEIIVAVGEHPGRAAGLHRRQGGGQARARGRSRRRISSSCTRPKDRRSRLGTTIVPQQADVLAKYAAAFPKVALFTIDEVFGGWTKAQKTHFDDGGIFDRIYRAGVVGEVDVGAHVARIPAGTGVHDCVPQPARADSTVWRVPEEHRASRGASTGTS